MISNMISLNEEMNQWKAATHKHSKGCNQDHYIAPKSLYRILSENPLEPKGEANPKGSTDFSLNLKN